MEKSYAISARVDFDRIHHCSYCGCSFSYPISKIITVVSKSEKMGADDMKNEAQKTVEQQMDSVPCPECGRYQPEMMISRYRKGARPDFLTIVPMIFMGLLLIVPIFFPFLWDKIFSFTVTLKDIDKIYFPVASGVVWLVMILQLCRWHALSCHILQSKSIKCDNIKENTNRAKWRKAKIIQPKGTFPLAESEIDWRGFKKPFYLLLASLLLLTLVDLTAIGFYFTNIIILLRHSEAQMMDRWEILFNGWYYLPKFVTLALLSTSLLAGSLDFIYAALLRKEIRRVEPWDKSVESENFKMTA